MSLTTRDLQGKMYVSEMICLLSIATPITENIIKMPKKELKRCSAPLWHFIQM